MEVNRDLGNHSKIQILDESTLADIQIFYHRKMRKALIGLMLFIFSQPLIIGYFSKEIITSHLNLLSTFDYYFVVSLEMTALFIIIGIGYFLVRRYITFIWRPIRGVKINIRHVRFATNKEIVDFFTLCERKVALKDYADRLSMSGRPVQNIDIGLAKKYLKSQGVDYKVSEHFKLDNY